MSGRRFEQIMANWHWVVIGQEHKAEAKRRDPFYLVEGFVELMADTAQHFWRLGQFVDIDEIVEPVEAT